MKTKLITVNVTATDIRKGERVDCFCCPVARALGRRLKSTLNLSVVGRYAYFGRQQEAYAELPTSVRQFISSFDARRKVRPFKFRVQIPTNYLK